MRFRVPEIFLGAMLVVCVFAMGMLFSSQPSNEPKREQSPNKAEAHSAEYPFVRFWNWTSHDPVAFYTFVLAIFTGVLGATAIVQIRYLRKADETARLAADAANLSAKAAIAIELPIIRVEPQMIGFGAARHEDNSVTEYAFVSSLTFSNLGRTKAFPIDVWCGWTVGNALPKEPFYRVFQPFRTDLIFEPGPNLRQKVTLTDPSIEFAPGEKAKVESGDLSLWFYCRLNYLDFMQTRHEAGYCWLLTKIGTVQAFRPYAAPAYNRKT